MRTVVKKVLVSFMIIAIVIGTYGYSDSIKAASRYQVKIVSLKKSKNISVNYPKITGWSNKKKQKLWNKKMKEQAESLIKDAGSDDEITMEYKIMTKQNNFLSIMGEGYMDYYGAAHPSTMMQTYNIDMRTGKTVTLVDKVNTNQLAKKLLKTKRYEMQRIEITINDILDSCMLFEDYPTKEKKMQVLLDSFDKYTEDKNAVSYGMSYWAKNKLHLVFEVPHVMGDYAVVMMK